MKKSQVRIGEKYTAKVNGKYTVVLITEKAPFSGWNAINVKTGRWIWIKTAGRLRTTAESERW